MWGLLSSGLEEEGSKGPTPLRGSWEYLWQQIGSHMESRFSKKLTGTLQ